MNKEWPCKYCNFVAESRRKLMAHRKAAHPEHAVRGGGCWNRGLKKSDNPSVAKMAETLKTGYASGKYKHHQLGKSRTEDEKRRTSETMKAGGCGGYNPGSGWGKHGHYKGFYCDSTYELVYVIYNLDNGIEFKRCDLSYDYEFKGKRHKYHPDFILSDGTLVEIKGYWTEVVDAKTKSVDRPILILYKEDLKPMFDWAKEHYRYKRLEDLYE